MKIVTLILILFTSVYASAQGTAVRPCSAPESSQFDFWLGNWNLTYNDTVHASNEITKELEGCVIYEHFKDPSGGLNGYSWSVYNVTTKQWQQTWVDDQGGYIVLKGTMQNGVMTLMTDPFVNKKGVKVQNRMIYYNIADKSFDWNWESTQDDGKNWSVNWKIHYERKKKS